MRCLPSAGSWITASTSIRRASGLRKPRKKRLSVELKEVKMRPKTEEHDFQFKLKNARRFLEEGNKVKVTVMFRGREVTHPEFGRRLLERVAEEVKDLGQVESMPSMSGRFMTMVMAPLKK